MGTIIKEVGPRRKCGPVQHGDWVEHRDPQAGLGQSAPGTIVVSKWMLERKREKHNGLCPVDTGVSEEVKVMKSRLRWVTGLLFRAIVTSRLGLLLGPKSGFMALDRAAACIDVCDSWYQEDGAVQSWPCPSLAATQGRICPGPHQLQHSGERPLHLTGATR